MLFLKSTSVTKAPGIYEVDVAAKPPGKTFGIFMATDPDNPPNAVLAALVIIYSIGLIQPAEFASIRKIRIMEFRWALAAFAENH